MDQTVSRLVIDVVTEAADAASGFDHVADSSKHMADQVEDSGARMARGLNVTADSTDNLASKSGQATGALGALSSGFELVGLGDYAAGLQGASMATDFLSGVGDSLNLVLESQAVKTAIARVQAIRHAVTSRVVAGATRVWAAAQWAMNAALNANPIGLVVVAVALLIAGIVLAYKHSRTFREAIQAAGRAGRVAVGWIVDRVSDLVHWVRENVPAAFRVLKGAAETYLRLVTLPIRTVISVAKDVVTWVGSKIPGAFSDAKDRAQAIGSAIVKPFKSVLDTVKSIIEWIKKIKVPHIPGFGRVADSSSSARVVDASDLSSGSGAGVGYYAPNGTVVRITNVIQGAIDPMGTAATVASATETAARRLGLVVI